MRVNPGMGTVFIPTPKCASTSIENLLDRNGSQIIFKSGLKHVNAQLFEDAISPLLSHLFPDQSFVSFALVRNPIDWLSSWWRYRQRLEISSLNSTKGISFSDFVCEYLKPKHKRKPFANVGQQKKFFLNSRNKVVIDMIFAFDNLCQVEDFLALKSGRPLSLPKKNVSPVFVSPQHSLEMLPTDILKAIRKSLHVEYKIYESALISPDSCKQIESLL